ncbi:MAG TPA: alpha/beta fold hydrolase [Methylomirabilota bacterium]
MAIARARSIDFRHEEWEMRHREVVTQVTVAAVLAGLIGAAVVVAQSDGPPAPRAFGPDTTAVGVFTGEGTTTPGLQCDAPPDVSIPLECSGFLASGLDGTLLDVTVRVPQTAGPHPLVVYVHGWGGSKNAGRQYDGVLAGAGKADAAGATHGGGYTYLRYSTRGFGKSWGQTNFGDVDVELFDLRSMVGQVVDDPRLQADPTAVAVMGASYGGAHSWIAAVQPTFTSPGGKSVRLRTVVPVAAGSDLLYSLIPNGKPNDTTSPAGGLKLSYLNGLFLTGFRQPSQARPYSNYPLYLFGWLAVTNGTEPNDNLAVWKPIVDGIQGYRSVYWQQEFWRIASDPANRVPIFQVQGFTDDLFPIHESLRMLRALKVVDEHYPIKSYFGDIGHPRAVNKAGEVDYVLDAILAWLDYFMKGVGDPPLTDVSAAITRPYATPFDPRDVIVVGDFASLGPNHVGWSFDGVNVITFNPANPSGFRWDPVVLLTAQELGANPPAPESDEIPGDVAVFDVPVSNLTQSADGLLIAGQPIVSFEAFSVAHRVQLDVRLFDVTPAGVKQLVTRGTYTVDTGSPATPIGRVPITIVTYGNVWPVAVGDTLRLEITNVDSPYIAPSRIPSVTELSKVSLDIPTR